MSTSIHGVDISQLDVVCRSHVDLPEDGAISFFIWTAKEEFSVFNLPTWENERKKRRLTRINIVPGMHPG